MKSPDAWRLVLLGAAALMIALLLSALFSIPYIYTATGFAAWMFVGALITIDDEFPGGWSNPDGAHPIPWAALGIKGAIFLALLAASTQSEFSQWGGPPD